MGCERAYDSWALFLGVGRNFLRTPRLHVDDFDPDRREDYVTNKHDVLFTCPLPSGRIAKVGREPSGGWHCSRVWSAQRNCADLERAKAVI